MANLSSYLPGGIDPSAVTITGGTINGTAIGASTAAAGTFTTFTSTGIDDNATSTAITIDSSQNVGIGTNSPRSVLDLGTSREQKIRFGTAGSIGETQSNAGDYIANNLIVSAESAGTMTYTKTSGDSGNAILQDFSRGVTFYTGVTGADTATGTLNNFERLRIDASGNVGIGTTSPSAIANYVVVEAQGDTTTTGGIYYTSSSDNSQKAHFYVGGGVGYLGTQTNHPLAFTTNNFERMRISSSGWVGIGTDGPSAPLTVKARDVDTIGLRILENSSGNSTVQFTDDPVTTGYGSIEVSSASFSVGGSGNFIIRAANVEKARIDTSGNLLVGQTASVSSRVDIKGASNTSSDYSLFCKNSDSTLSFYVRNDGIINVGQDGNSPYNYSVTGRDLYVDSVGTMGYLSSTRESKANIESLSDISWLYNLSPVSFNYREKDQETGSYTDQIIQEIEYGLIADEVEQVNPNLCFYDADEEGNQTLAGVSYRKLIPVLTKAIQEQQAMIEELKAEVAALKGA